MKRTAVFIHAYGMNETINVMKRKELSHKTPVLLSHSIYIKCQAEIYLVKEIYQWYDYYKLKAFPRDKM